MKKYEKPVIIANPVNRKDILTASPSELLKDVGDYWTTEVDDLLN